MLISYIGCVGSISASSKLSNSDGWLIPEYEHIREHVTNTPANLENNRLLLSKYLVDIASNDREKAYAIFYWITENIKYDVSGFRSGKLGDLTPDGVIRRKSAVCSGYSALFADLAKKVGLEVEEISGKSKAYGYSERGLPADSDHAWNALKIDGKWYLLDATWAAGNVDSSFNRKQNDFYFMTPPEQFIFDHFPDNPNWQLLSDTLSEQEFIDLVEVEPAFFIYGLELNSHKQSTIKATEELVISLKAPKNTHFNSVLYDDDNRLEDFSFVQIENDVPIFRVSFPKSGNYMLKIFANNASKQNSYDQVLKYNIIVNSLSAKPNQYPKAFPSLQQTNARLIKPFNKKLDKGIEHNFEIKIPDVDEVAVIEGGRFHYLEKMSGNLFSGQVFINDDKVSIAAKINSSSSKSFSSLVAFEGR